MQYAVGLALIAALALVLRHRGPGLAAFGLGAVNFAVVLSTCTSSIDGRPAMTILSANVLASNDDHDALLASIAAKSPDVVVVLELSHALAERLAALPDYPTRLLEAREDNFGIGLLAKAPMQVEVVDFDKGGIPTIVATTPELTLIATHPIPPSGGANAERRDLQLGAIAAKVRALDRPTIVVGDLNTTPWAASFDILEGAGLEDTRTGLHTTWPTGFFPLAIPIDHCLVTRHLGVRAREVLDDIGSDHYPIWVDLAWRE